MKIMKNNLIEKNKVVIIGADHHNTLAIIRCLGKKRIENKILIHGKIKQKKDIMVAHSKYAKNIEIIDEEEKKILKWLLDNKIENLKQVIIPCSDFAEYIIDNNYEQLKDSYYMPGFKNNPGMVCKMMDKFEQKKWADKNNIPMAKSWLINKINDDFELPGDIVYPCIIKPNISAFGEKRDIRICNNKSEVVEGFNSFKDYKQIIIQEFLIKKYEICYFGCIVEKR